MESLKLLAPVKVNLYLHVTGRRDDGYHLVDTLIAFGGFGDEVTVEPSDGISLTIDGPFSEDLPVDDANLVVRALTRLRHETGVLQGAKVHLHKQIPLASGMGGGSSDAGAALLGAARLWKLPDGPETDQTVMEVAKSLGADVPACVYRRPCYASGIGQDLLAAPIMPRAGMVLINPGIKLSTPSVFRERRSGFTPDMADANATFDDVGALIQFLEERDNNLTNAAIRLAPAVEDVLYALNELPGCRLARMSGSGATCFALFDDLAAAEHAAAQLDHPFWWVCATEIKIPVLI